MLTVKEARRDISDTWHTYAIGVYPGGCELTLDYQASNPTRYRTVALEPGKKPTWNNYSRLEDAVEQFNREIAELGGSIICPFE